MADGAVDPAELEAENIRLRERIALLEADRDRYSPQDMGLAGRLAITRLRDTDAVDIEAVIERIPVIYEQRGWWAAMSYCRNDVKRYLKTLSLRPGLTGTIIQAQKRIGKYLSEVQAPLLFFRTMPGPRIELLEAINEAFYEPAVQATFAKSIETPPGILPQPSTPRHR